MTADEDEPVRGRGIGRRNLLLLGSGVAVGAGLGVGGSAAVGGDAGGSGGDDSAEPEPEAEGTESGPARHHYVSVGLSTAAVTTFGQKGREPAPGYLFGTPRTENYYGLIYDNDGEPVWIEPDGRVMTTLRVQEYRGEPVLTFWSGRIVGKGTGLGAGIILDQSYQPVATVRAGNGALVDLHEFRLTARGTALLIGYPVEPMDLREVGGPQEGYAHDCRIQEVDVATGEVLFDWSGLDHIGLAESRRSIEDTGSDPDTPYDPIHANSVEEDGERLLVSARHTSTIYAIDRRTGEIAWRLGGDRSDFAVPDEAAFSWQHDARRHPDGTLSLFDNHGEDDDGGPSACLVLRLDEQAKTVELVRALRLDGRYGAAMGNAQVLENGHVLVGWGTDPSATEFDRNGEVVFDVQALGLGCYRSYRAKWTGRPQTDPDVAVRRSGSKMAVFASWNGATEVVRWRVRSGPSAERLTAARTARRTGFETEIRVPPADYAAVDALDASGAVLGSSRTLRVR